MKNPRAATTATRVGCFLTTERTQQSYPSLEKIQTPECPRFAKCSSNICPVDEGWPQRKHIRGEPICLYLREAVKVGGLAVLGVHIPAELSKQVVRALPEIIDRYADMSRRLKRSATTPSKIVSRKEQLRVA